MRSAAMLLPVVWLTLCGCSSSSSSSAQNQPGTDAAVGTDATDSAAPSDADSGGKDADSHSPDGDVSDAADASMSDVVFETEVPDGDISDAADESNGATYRNSLSICWNDATCPRVMAIAHGGAWDAVKAPYDSNAALSAAYDIGIDGVKIDVRVTKDNVPVISHSSPIETYESLDCNGKKIEEMTAAQVTACHRFPSTTEKFQRLDDVLEWLRGKMVVQLCVKLDNDTARMVEALHASNAEDFAFLEIRMNVIQNLLPTIPGADTIYYLMDLGTDVASVDTLLNSIKNPRAFMYEFDPTVDVSTMVKAQLHPAGVRSFTYDDSATAGVQELQKLFEGGYDVVSAQTAGNDVTARMAVNNARGVSPP